jgi:hypothetical protein
LRRQDYFFQGVPEAEFVVSAGGSSFFFPNIIARAKKMAKNKTSPNMA